MGTGGRGGAGAVRWAPQATVWRLGVGSDESPQRDLGQRGREPIYIFINNQSGCAWRMDHREGRQKAGCWWRSWFRGAPGPPLSEPPLPCVGGRRLSAGVPLLRRVGHAEKGKCEWGGGLRSGGLVTAAGDRGQVVLRGPDQDRDRRASGRADFVPAAGPPGSETEHPVAGVGCARVCVCVCGDEFPCSGSRD